MELSIIIVNYNVRQLVLDCVRSVIDGAKELDYEIVVVDNASSDGSVEALKGAFPQIPQIRVIANSENVGFARANNQGYEMSRGEFILLLNPDTVVRGDAVKSALEFLKMTPDAGIACCRLLNPDGTLQKSIRVFPSLADHILRVCFLDRAVYSVYRRETYYREKPFRIDYAAGAFLLIRKAAVEETPLLNPDFFMYAEEKDFALRLLERGWYTYYVPSAEIVHYGGQSTAQMATEMFLDLQKSQIKYFATHYRGWHRLVMVWSYYLVLLSSWMASGAFVFTGYGRHRFRLFMAAVRHYPSFILMEKSFGNEDPQLTRMPVR